MASSLVALLSLSALAADTGDVTTELTHRKVSIAANGKELLSSADKALPGDVIEYKTVYRNKGKKLLKSFVANLPVPKGMEFVPGSARPTEVLATVDGTSYAPVPLKKKVKLANGKEELKEIPPAEYRALRWNLNELAAGKSLTTSARMKIGSNEAPSGKK